MSENTLETEAKDHNYGMRSKAKKGQSEVVENLFPLRAVSMGGVIGGIGFVNAPLTASKV